MPLKSNHPLLIIFWRMFFGLPHNGWKPPKKFFLSHRDRNSSLFRRNFVKTSCSCRKWRLLAVVFQLQPGNNFLEFFWSDAILRTRAAYCPLSHGYWCHKLVSFPTPPPSTIYSWIHMHLYIYIQDIPSMYTVLCIRMYVCVCVHCASLVQLEFLKFASFA